MLTGLLGYVSGPLTLAGGPTPTPTPTPTITPTPTPTPTPGGGLSIVQQKKLASIGVASGTIAISPTAGNLLVVIVISDGATLAAQDNHGNTFTIPSTPSASQNTTGVQQTMLYLKNIASGITGITISGGSTFIQGIVTEISGASTTAPFTANESNNNSGTGVTSLGSNSVTNGTPASIIIAGCSIGGSSASSTIAVTSSGWGIFDSTSGQYLDGSTFEIQTVSNATVASSAAQAATWTWTADGIQPAGAVIAAFHA